MFRDATFDAVFCVLSLYHFNDPLKGLREINRVLKKNGQFVLCEPMAPEDAKLKGALAEAFQLAHSGYKLFSVAELYSLAADAGFERKKSATEEIAFDQDGVTGIPNGVHYLEAYQTLQRRGQKDLQARFEKELFKVSGEMAVHVKGSLKFSLLVAGKK